MGVLVAVGGLLFGCQRQGGEPCPRALRGVRPLAQPTRAVWVARMHYHYPDDIRTIMRNCARMGFNTVLWQVRGDGTVAYRSKLEPWSREYNFRDPGFDPLEIAVEEAHKNGLRIEAWVNLLPGWRGPSPPPLDPMSSAGPNPPIGRQLYHAHRDWFLRDGRGAVQPLGDFYAILNPCLPEVRRYLTALIDELVSCYEVDGVHLDYVRYAWDTTPDAKTRYPRDSRTLALFHQKTGKRPDEDAARWDAWRAAQLTRLVAQIQSVVQRRRSGATLTAAVVADPRRAYHDYLQDWRRWLNSGIVAALMPMVYTDDIAHLARRVGGYSREFPQRLLIPGIGLYKHQDRRQTAEQVAYCLQQSGSFAVFSYDSLYATALDREKGARDPREDTLRWARREVLSQFNRR